MNYAALDTEYMARGGYWDVLASGQMVLEKYCQHAPDWLSIRDSIVSSFGDAKTILDFGAGQGRNTTEIAQIHFANIEHPPTIDIIEPGQKEREIAASLLGEEGHGGFLRSAFATQETIDDDRKYDCVVALHSCYYITSEGLQDLYVRRINEGGRLLILTLSEKSPFYEIAPRQPHRTEDICQVFSNFGCNIAIRQLRSRFMLDAFVKHSTSDEIEGLKNYVHKQDVPTLDFVESLKNLSSGGAIDFSDQLVVVEKPIRAPRVGRSCLFQAGLNH